MGDDDFREQLANQTKEGKREWIYPSIIKGKFYKYRNYLSWFLLALFFSAPFIKVGEYPFLLLNILERKFVIFGQPFWPQDFLFFVFTVLTFLVFIVLFTVVFGRVWCGWACPQTIFMEMVFRKIENWIEGNASQQKKLSKMPWNFEKILKKSIKHGLFYLISFIISHTFLAYIIGYENLWSQMKGPISENLVTFFSLILFSFVFYFVFAKMRELVCIMVCPYGRLQGVMLDQNSMVVAYDHIRGEPRGKIRRAENQKDKGDCVDCMLCVNVCPTGIDIRNGTQLECINCTACIDACEMVMEKVNLPTGLIRIDSKNNIEKNKNFKWTSRIIAYIAAMIILLSSSLAIVLTRESVEVNVFRAAGKTYSESSEVHISNIFNLSLVNKTFEDKKYDLKIKKTDFSKGTSLLIIQEDSLLKTNSEKKKVFIIYKDKKTINDNETPIDIEVYIDDKFLKTLNITFLAPITL